MLMLKDAFDLHIVSFLDNFAKKCKHNEKNFLNFGLEWG